MKSNTQAFTLIELLIVVLVIGILAAVALPQYRIAVEKSRATEAITAVHALAEAEKVYYLANGEYSTNLDEMDITVTKYTQNWDFYLKYANDPEYPWVYARKHDAPFANGRWYIGYRLDTNILFCMAEPSDTQSLRICKTFGSTSYECTPPDKHTYICFPIQ